MLNRKIKDLQNAIAAIAVTPNGRILFGYLESTFLNPSCLGSTPEETAYKLGQKELVQKLVKLSNLSSKELSRMTEGYRNEQTR